jgi:hypothetical protein
MSESFNQIQTQQSITSSNSGTHSAPKNVFFCNQGLVEEVQYNRKPYTLGSVPRYGPYRSVRTKYDTLRTKRRLRTRTDTIALEHSTESIDEEEETDILRIGCDTNQELGGMKVQNAWYIESTTVAKLWQETNAAPVTFNPIRHRTQVFPK